MTLVGDRDGSMRQWVEQTSATSAALVAPLLIELTRPASVLDVGCGNGAWLRAFQDLGVHDLLGLDGPEVDPATLRVDASRFRGVDLSSPPDTGRTYDLVCCLEVGEHLPGPAAATLVGFLCRTAAKAVLFSAALPGQGGAGHVNEQWPDYWYRLFEEQGFAGVDVIRPRIWNDDRIAFWYRQNTFLFVPRAQAAAYGPVAAAPPLRSVHPDLFARANRKPRLETYTPRQLFWALRKSLWSAWKGSPRDAAP